ncbi:hypothetical protein [Streptomyces longisporoflavus]|uniref:Uncharacterized protein n=1 Tax=Streptomyces longisporoflavus TaxID=28044 RepID=A0ABW7QH26_9ACTN
MGPLLVTVLDESAGEGCLAAVHDHPAGPWPAVAAAEAGRALADQLGVPFRFAGRPRGPGTWVT